MPAVPGLRLELPGPEADDVSSGVIGATPRLTPRELKRAKKLAEKRKRSALCSVPGNAAKEGSTAGAAPTAAAKTAKAASPREGGSGAAASDAAPTGASAAAAAEPAVEAGQQPALDEDENDRAKRPRPQESAELSELFDQGMSQCAIECAKTSPTPSPTEGEGALWQQDETSSSRDGLELEELAEVPTYDASLKERCKVSSPQPFDWTVLSATVEQAAVERFVESGSRHNDDEDDEDEDEERLDGTDFAEALMHWRFPDAPLPPSLRKTFARNVAGGAAARDRSRNDDKQYCLARLEEWGSSFRALYTAFKNGACSEVYVTSKAFTIIFAKRQPGERFAGDDGYCAVMTRSTRGLRQRLEDEVVEFVLPCEAAAAASPSGSESEASRDGMIDEAEAAETRRFLAQADADTIYKAQTVDVRDGTPSSLVVAAGIEGVAGVYDFFLNYVKDGEGELDDVPTLYATCPFYRASIGRAKWENLGETQSGSARGARQSAPCYTLDITGILLPGNLAKLYADLNRHQPRGYQMRFKTTEKTRGVNVALAAPKGWGGAGADSDAAAERSSSASKAVDDDDEEEKRDEVPPNHVISKVDCVGGRFRVQTSSTGNA